MHSLLQPAKCQELKICTVVHWSGIEG